MIYDARVIPSGKPLFTRRFELEYDKYRQAYHAFDKETGDEIWVESYGALCEWVSSLTDQPEEKKIKSVYLIGSLRNEEVPKVAESLRTTGLDVFDDWYGAGPEADDYWKRYEEARGHSYIEALGGHAARHVFEFDRHHLDRCDAACLVLPAGKSGHLELGYVAGTGKPTFILLDRPDRWDVMYQFATKIFSNPEEMYDYFRSEV
jgi:hypothetical protein